MITFFKSHIFFCLSLVVIWLVYFKILSFFPEEHIIFKHGCCFKEANVLIYGAIPAV